ncbi:MAG: hypothetical protein JWP89_836 [Schlesneria sp.]|nr:hypothetical protein [Schlesneria sp.]
MLRSTLRHFSDRRSSNYKRLSFVAALIAAGTIVSTNQVDAQPQPKPKGSGDAADYVSRVIKDIHKQIEDQKGASQTFKTAVFPIGDSNGNVTESSASTSIAMQGEIISQLTTLVTNETDPSRKYFIIPSGGLRRYFQTAGVDPSGVISADPAATGKILKTVGIDAAVLGNLDFKNAAEKKEVEVKPELVVISAKAAASNIPPQEGFAGSTLPSPVQKPSGRFNVQFFVGAQELELKKGKVDGKPESPYHNVFFLLLDPSLLEKEFSIRLTNNGAPAVGWKHPNDANRCYAAAVLLDGVSSFYIPNPRYKTGSAMPEEQLQYVPEVRLPKNVNKWILTPKGKMVGDGKLIDNPTPNDVKHWQVNIPGFQQGSGADATAAKFLFTDAKPSVAETVGVTNSIGMIEVHFYPEDLGDADMRTGAGGLEGPKVGAGANQKNPVQQFTVKLHSNPVEVWRIFYRTNVPEPKITFVPITSD